jgi:UDP-3-O-acyl-N-acetylglucosamine deacetylase
MTTTLDNLEKLIQMATIEHMYSMLQKMKIDNSTNLKEKENENILCST